MADVQKVLDALERSKPVAKRVKDTPWPADDPVNGHRGQVWIITGAGKWHAPDRLTLNGLYASGLIRADDDLEPAEVAWDAIDGYPVIS